MTIRSRTGKSWLYHLIDEGSEDREPVNKWVSIDYLLKRYKSAGLDRKTLYDRLRRLAYSEGSGNNVTLKTVYDCSAAKTGESGTIGRKSVKDRGFQQFKTKIGVLGV